ncbi:hypothetical protein PUW79_07950 [Microbacterium sp. NE2HP2]|uniref:hypothetical protein n=1 Tax=Microbacterium plantarum TaxID=1816425 RepID=UPI002366EB60|nr:hypothetical protein [Microbacterium plantarum]MDD7944560.1 hypothetical protein [Microbacterium plantarum]
MRPIRRGLVLLLPVALMLGAFGWAPDAFEWFPDLKLNPKLVLAVTAALTAVSFAYSDSDAPTDEKTRTAAAKRRDCAKLVTHSLAIVTAGWAVYFTVTGEI